MLGYYFRLALLSVARSRVLVALIIGAIALGVGAFMTTYNLYHVASGNPIPHKSERLFHVRIDNSIPGIPEFFGLPDGIPPHITWHDGVALYTQAPAPRQAVSMPTGFAVATPGGERPFTSRGRHTTPELFDMFDVPFRYGAAWSSTQEEGRAQVAVITPTLNERLFGGEDSVGRQILLDDRPFRIIGVFDHWDPVPRFYDLTNGTWADVEDVWTPFSLIEPLESNPQGTINCMDDPTEPGHAGFLRSECNFASLWAELPDERAVADYDAFLQGYVEQARAAGRLPNPGPGYALDDVSRWLTIYDVVGSDTLVYVLAAGLFLLVCLVNTVGLLLAKFLSRSADLGVRRALGATRGDLFMQHIIECLLIGVLGGALGVLLGWGGLRVMRTLFENLAKLTAFDPPVIAFAVVTAIAASVLAGLYPAWRACLASPAAQIRSA